MTEVNFVAPLNKLGFGVFSFIFYKILKRRGFKINWQVIGSPSTEDMIDITEEFSKDLAITLDELTDDMAREPNHDAPTLVIWHPNQVASQSDHLSDTRRIAVTHFETSALGFQEIKELSQMDKVFVCSEWASEVLYLSGLDKDKCGVIPGICAPLHINYSEDPESTRSSISQDVKTIVSWMEKRVSYEKNSILISSAGKWEQRKSQFLQVLALEHPYSRPVALLCCWSNPFDNDTAGPLSYLRDREVWGRIHTATTVGVTAEFWQHKESKNTILIFPFLRYVTNLHVLMEQSNIYLSTSAGEGWDQPLVEAMSLGKICIATFNTAHTAYLTPDNSIQLNCGKEIADDGRWFKGDKGYWYPTSEQEVVRGIQKAINTLAQDKPVGEIARRDIHNICSDEKIYTILEEALEVCPPILHSTK